MPNLCCRSHSSGQFRPPRISQTKFLPGRSHLMSSAEPQWTLEQLQGHLQAAVDLEFWTIPYYMAAAYSIKDQGETAFQLILSVVNQEMLHVQLAGNIAKTYGPSPRVKNPGYKGGQSSALDCSLHDPDPQTSFPAARSEIGQLDTPHV